MHAWAETFQEQSSLMEFTTDQQKRMFELLISGKRGLFFPFKELGHPRLMAMLWIYCHAACRLPGQPTRESASLRRRPLRVREAFRRSSRI